MEIIQIIWTILAGIGIATAYLWYNRRFLGTFVRKLLEIDASSPETAVTMEAVHCRLTGPLKAALREDGALHDSILTTKEEPVRYYIPPKKQAMLKTKYRNENNNPVSVILIFCLLIVVGVLFSVLYPIVTDFLDTL